jgi:hypothetical protein
MNRTDVLEAEHIASAAGIATETRAQREKLLGSTVADPRAEPGARAPMLFSEKIACTIAQGCEATGLGNTTMWKLIGDREIETIRIGRRRLIVVASLLRYIASRPDPLAGRKLKATPPISAPAA